MVDLDETRDWFVKELRDLIEYEGLRICDVAEHCGISTDRLNNYLQGRSLPNPYILSVLADLLSCTTNDLLDFDEPDEDELVGYDPLDMFEDTDEFMMHIRNRIERHMRDNKVSIAELSEQTGFNKHTIKYWLGMLKHQPTLIRTSDLIRIADALDCTPSDLLGY